MKFPFCPPVAFWRDWLLVSGRVFARTVVALFVLLSLVWPLLSLVEPHPGLLARAVFSADVDDPWACAGRDE
ncbi:hypothetical protein ACG04R_06435 [Roseateles sp. BYS78W]|uniref:Uncharacterized protein n=1 Tax=Pelomonas candidula TaxID=3299025 RepID=A0ABW7H8Q2_9BURK